MGRADRLFANSQFAEAARLYEVALEKNPLDSNLASRLATSCYLAGDFDRAGDLWVNLLAMNPSDVEINVNLSACLARQGRFAEAIGRLEGVVQSHEDHQGANQNLANCYLKLSRYEDAESCYRHLISIQRDHPQAYIGLGDVLLETGDIEGASASFERAAMLDETSFRATYGAAVASYDLGCLARAGDWFRETIRRKPGLADAHFGLSVLTLLSGDLDAAWADFEWRQLKPEFHCPKQVAEIPRWGGEPLAGKRILVYAEQGFGDTIQFSRFLMPLLTEASVVSLICHEALRRLMKQSFPRLEVLASVQEAKGADYQLPLLSLPFEFSSKAHRSDRELTLGQEVNYLKAPLGKRHDDGLFRVGVAWRGNPNNPHDSKRRISLKALEKLIRIPGVRPVCLQKDDPDNEWMRSGWHHCGENPTGRLSDFADTAAAINELDLVLTVDTSIAHLSAALGKETWVMVMSTPHWPYGLRGSTTPWYPSMRIYRQERRGEWEPVLMRVCRDLMARSQASFNQG